jgi:DNA-binding GntR family transcriptional regulator
MSLEGNVQEDIIADHTALLVAIRKRDKLQAREIVARHLNRYIIDKNMIYQRYPEYILGDEEANPKTE